MASVTALLLVARWSVAIGGRWLNGARGLGDSPAHNIVYCALLSRAKLVHTEILFPFIFLLTLLELGDIIILVGFPFHSSTIIVATTFSKYIHFTSTHLVAHPASI